MANGEWLIQITDHCKTSKESGEILHGLSLQDDFVGGRITLNHDGRFLVQSFHEDATCAGMSEGWLPDGCRRVFVLDSQRKRFLVTLVN